MLWAVQPLVMRTAVILSTSLMIAAAALAQVEDGEQVLRQLLRDIPAEDLTTASPDDSQADIRAAVDDATVRPTDTEPLPSQCRRSCVTVGMTLDTLCERHVRVQAPRSRAICFTRVDERRTQCLASCGE